MNHIPANLQAVLWSQNIKDLDLAKNKRYIIHYILMYGSLDDIHWLIATYGLAIVQDTFVQRPLPIYTKPAYHFIKTFILKLTDDTPLNEKNYVKRLY